MQVLLIRNYKSLALVEYRLTMFGALAVDE